MARIRYVIQHHPGLMTEILVEREGVPTKTQIENRFDWGTAREYCRNSMRKRGVEPVIERPEPYVEVFPWVELEA